MCGDDMRERASKGMTRRGFLASLTGILAAPIAVFMGWPFVASLVGPIYRIGKQRFVKVGEMKNLPAGEPTALIFKMPSPGGYIHSEVAHTIWAIKHSESKVTVFSPICPHLGCHYAWYGDAEKFICPCHGSVYSIDGKVLAGPAPRPLDTLPARIENGALYVKWELFEVGTPKKIMIG